MKYLQNQILAGSKTKALTVMAICLAGSLVLSMTVVSVVIKWLA